MQTTQMDIHPLGTIFPLMSDEELEELAADIKRNGLQKAIATKDGAILDGKCRLRACEIAGVRPRFEEIGDGVDPLAFVLIENLHRRHLNPSQRAMIAAKVVNLTTGSNQFQTRYHQDNLPRSTPTPITVKKAAERLKVSERSVHTAKLVHASGTAEQIADVMAGRSTVHEAVTEIAERQNSEVRPADPLRDEWERFCAAIDAVVGKLDDVIRRLEEIKDSPFGYNYHWETIFGTLRDVRQRLIDGRPSRKCPGCMGKGEDKAKKKCSTCRGAGHLSERKYKSACEAMGRSSEPDEQ